MFLVLSRVIQLKTDGCKLSQFIEFKQGSNSTMSLDGHDKLCGYQKSMFPLSIYGGLDTYSGRMNFLRVRTTNNNPLVIGRLYFEYLFESRGRIF